MFPHSQRLGWIDSTQDLVSTIVAVKDFGRDNHNAMQILLLSSTLLKHQDSRACIPYFVHISLLRNKCQASWQALCQTPKRGKCIILAMLNPHSFENRKSTKRTSISTTNLRHSTIRTINRQCNRQDGM